jgi:hypothetical protein
VNSLPKGRPGSGAGWDERSCQLSAISSQPKAKATNDKLGHDNFIWWPEVALKVQVDFGDLQFFAES